MESKMQPAIACGNHDMIYAAYGSYANLTHRGRETHICVSYMRQWTRPSLVQIVDFRLIGDKPLSAPMLTYNQLDIQDDNSVKY